MTTTARRRSARRLGTTIELVPEVLVIVAEAAWISVLGGLIEEFALRQPVFGIPVVAVVVTAGVIAARTIGPRAGPRWPPIAFALVLVAAGLGTLLSGVAAGLDGGTAGSLGSHPGALLAGLAMFRGFAHARLPPAEGTLTRMLGLGVPGLAFAALIGGLIVEPYRSSFLADTLTASILFVSSTILALAFARLGAIGGEQGLDWRRNPIWLALAFSLLLGAIALALPVANIAGLVIAVLMGIAIGPLVVVGLLSGLDRAGRRILLFVGLLVLIAWVRSLLGGAPTPRPALPGAPPDGPADEVANQIAAIGFGGLVLLGGIATILILAALWMRRGAPADDSVEETRTVDRGGDPASLARLRRRRTWRRAQPTDAAEAYVALLADIDRHNGVRRERGETPREHAARLRASGVDLSLDLLAADYALVRDGGRTLSVREHARAIQRWRELRHRLGRRRIEPEAGATAEDAIPDPADRTEPERPRFGG